MQIDIYVNDVFYKRQDLGDTETYRLSNIIEEVSKDYHQGLLSHITDKQDYKLTINKI